MKAALWIEGVEGDLGMGGGKPQDALVDEARNLKEVASQVRTVLPPEAPKCLEEIALEMVCLHSTGIVPGPSRISRILLARPQEDGLSRLARRLSLSSSVKWAGWKNLDVTTCPAEHP